MHVQIEEVSERHAVETRARARGRQWRLGCFNNCILELCQHAAFSGIFALLLVFHPAFEATAIWQLFLQGRLWMVSRNHTKKDWGNCAVFFVFFLFCGLWPPTLPCCLHNRLLFLPNPYSWHRFRGKNTTLDLDGTLLNGFPFRSCLQH